MEELRDVYQHFMLYYGPDVSAMQEAMKLKEREEAKRERERKKQERLARRAENPDVRSSFLIHFGFHF
jgi:transcription elongation factor SPT6